MSFGDWTLLGALYLCACLLKENALVLPGLLAGSEILVADGPMRGRVRALLPGYVALAALAALAVAILLIRISVQGHFDAPARADALVGLSARIHPDRVAARSTMSVKKV